MCLEVAPRPDRFQIERKVKSSMRPIRNSTEVERGTDAVSNELPQTATESALGSRGRLLSELESQDLNYEQVVSSSLDSSPMERWLDNGRRGNLKAGIANVIMAQILSGEIRSGQRVDQDEIAKNLGVSRLPVREALIMIENVGFVRSIPRRGTFVAEITPEDVLDHYEIFGMAAGLAARNAAVKMQDGQFQELERLIVQMHHNDGPGQLADLNYHFHRLINVDSSTRLRAHLRSLSRAMPMRVLLMSDVFAPQAEAQHHEILDALIRRDSEDSASAAKNHVVTSGQYVVEILLEAGFWA